VRKSPLVEDKPQVGALVGAAYDFGSHADYGAPGKPLYVKLLGGRATECNFLPVVALRCGSTRTGDDTRVWGVELGRPLVEQVNGWPLDFAAYVGMLAHDERGLRSDGLQLDAQIKARYYGFPWSERVRTRLAFGPAGAIDRGARPGAPVALDQPPAQLPRPVSGRQPGRPGGQPAAEGDVHRGRPVAPLGHLRFLPIAGQYQRWLELPVRVSRDATLTFCCKNGTHQGLVFGNALTPWNSAT
jgi:hypothetical protein